MSWLLALIFNIAVGIVTNLLTDGLKSALSSRLDFRPEKPSYMLAPISHSQPAAIFQPDASGLIFATAIAVLVALEYMDELINFAVMVAGSGMAIAIGILVHNFRYRLSITDSVSRMAFWVFCMITVWFAAHPPPLWPKIMGINSATLVSIPAVYMAIITGLQVEMAPFYLGWRISAGYLPSDRLSKFFIFYLTFWGIAPVILSFAFLVSSGLLTQLVQWLEMLY